MKLKEFCCSSAMMQRFSESLKVIQMYLLLVFDSELSRGNYLGGLFKLKVLSLKILPYGFLNDAVCHKIVK